MNNILNDIKIYVINMDEDKEKLFEFSKKLNDQNIKFERFPGVKITEENKQFYIDQKLLNPNYPLKNRGWVGLAMAHSSLWKHIYNLNCNEKYFLIFEDDEVIHDNYVDKLNGILNEIEYDFDFLNLNTLRTDGELIGEYVYKIQKKTLTGGKLPNVWTSSYIINKKFTNTLINIINPEFADFDFAQFDVALVKKLYSVADKYNLYVCPTNIISTHVEDRSKSAKIRYNEKV